MTVIVCPVCEHADVDPEPEWAPDDPVPLEEVCEHCARELYGDDESRWP